MIIKCRISNNLGNALKKILEKKEQTQQEFVESLVKEYILNNISLVLEVDNK